MLECVRFVVRTLDHDLQRNSDLQEGNANFVPVVAGQGQGGVLGSESASRAMPRGNGGGLRRARAAIGGVQWGSFRTSQGLVSDSLKAL